MSIPDEALIAARERMIRDQLIGRGIHDKRVIQAFRHVPREAFVDASVRQRAYADEPLPIGQGQTISQPYMVALMVHCLELRGTERVLEVGTGSGYEAAVLSQLAQEVATIERIPALAEVAQGRLERVGCVNVTVITGDGSLGWIEDAPYDGIIVAAGAPNVPEPLIAQLAEGGRIIIPVGDRATQSLVVGIKEGGELHTKEVINCVFVPLIGQAAWEA